MAGNDIIQQLMQLAGPILASPKGQAMAQAVLSQMGGGGGADPRARMAQQMPPGPTPGRSPAAMASPMGDGTDESDMVGAPSTEAELAMAQRMMGQGPGDMSDGGTGPGSMNPQTQGQDQGGGINKDGPTPQEAQMLRSNPSPRNQANFDKLFGKGAAQMVLQSGGQNLGTAPGSGGGSYEDDVRGAMDDEANHAKGIYGRAGRGEPLKGDELDYDD